jgi:hypothetical protein
MPSHNDRLLQRIIDHLAAEDAKFKIFPDRPRAWRDLCWPAASLRWEPAAAPGGARRVVHGVVRAT